MYVNNKYNIKIEINLDNGIYLFSNEASTGKTRLFKVLRKIQGYDKDVKTFTYDDFLENDRTIDTFLNSIKNDIKVIFVDRFDMIDTTPQIITKFNELKHKHIILVDCKQIDTLSQCDFLDACISMTENSITVTK